MHRLFVSEGIVLGKRLVGESNTLCSILTKDMGLVRAAARSARRENSKLRYGLEVLTSGTFSFIRGKHEWKLTGAQDLSHALLPASASARRAAGRVARLVLRLIHGEESNAALYQTLLDGLSAIARTPQEESTEHIEAVLVLRILAHLGYLPQTRELEPFITQDFFSIELAREAEQSRALLIKAINDSLSATGL